MSLPPFWTRRLGLTARLTLPFAVIFITALTGLGAVSIYANHRIIFELLATRAEITVRTLARTLWAGSSVDLATLRATE